MADAQQALGRRSPTPRGLISRLLPSTLKGKLLGILFGVVLPSLALFGVLHHDLVKRALLYEVDESLSRRADEVGQLLDKAGVDSPDDLAGFRLANAPLLRTATPEVYVDLVDTVGRSLWMSDNLTGTRIPNGVETAFSQPGFSTLKLPDGLRLRKFSEPAMLGDGTRIVIVVAESLSHLDAPLQASIGQSVLLAAVILTVTGVLGTWAVRGSFAPLDDLVETAERIVSTDDVTQRVDVGDTKEEHIRRTGEAFNAAMSRVEHLLEVARELLADTSHELRNPLTVLMTDLDLLRNDLPAQEREEVVSEAQATVQRMTNLVRNLLLLSRIEALSEAVKLTATDVHALTERVASRLRKAFVDNAERLVVLPYKGAPPLAMLHAERTEQILTNLLENAIFYSEGAIEISVACQGDRVILSVRDDGCGIPAEAIPRLFDRFFRIDRSRTRSSGGTGLGLPVARALARAQKGDILVESKLGEGSCFHVVFTTAWNKDEDE